METWKEVDFLFYLRRLISGSSLAIPSKTENLAHPPKHQKALMHAPPSGGERIGPNGLPRPPTPGSARGTGARPHQVGTPGGTRLLENTGCLELKYSHIISLLMFLFRIPWLLFGWWPMLDFAWDGIFWKFQILSIYFHSVSYQKKKKTSLPWIQNWEVLILSYRSSRLQKCWACSTKVLDHWFSLMNSLKKKSKIFFLKLFVLDSKLRGFDPILSFIALAEMLSLFD